MYRGCYYARDRFVFRGLRIVDMLRSRNMDISMNPTVVSGIRWYTPVYDLGYETVTGTPVLQYRDGDTWVNVPEVKEVKIVGEYD